MEPLISDVLVAINALLQAIDLHTTSEILKRRLGVEGNKRLAWLNAPGEHAAKFWRLAAIKGALMAGMVAVAFIQRYLVDVGAVGIAWFVIATQAGLALYYAPIMVSNWRIWKGQV